MTVTLETAERRKHSSGYVYLRWPCHPLASQGSISEHRAVFFEANGTGPHSCHWCAKPLLLRTELLTRDTLIVDHLDGSRDNNQPGNLVPSCLVCNTQRGKFPERFTPAIPTTGGEGA